MYKDFIFGNDLRCFENVSTENNYKIDWNKNLLNESC